MDLYELIPPVIGFVVAAIIVPLQEHLAGRAVSSHFSGKLSSDEIARINDVATDRTLQIDFGVTVSSFCASVISIARTDRPAVLVGVVVVGVEGGLLMALHLLMRTPGYHATSRFKALRKTPLANWTSAKLCAWILALANVVLIVMLLVLRRGECKFSPT